MRNYRHLVRLAGLYLAIVAGFLVFRAVVVPASYGKLGRYRAAAVDEEKARKPVHAGQEACRECHQAQWGEIRGGKHRGLRCETCHGPGAAHAGDPSGARVARPEGERVIYFCLKCHGRVAGRPVSFPQVVASDHNPGNSCIVCHKPHSPVVQ